MWEWAVAHYDVLKDFAGPATTFVGFVVTTIVALVGLKTFGRWSRERVEERRIAIAIDALAIGYEAQLVFERIRSRRVREFEYAEMRLDDTPVIVVGEQRRQQGSFFAVLKRIEAHEEFFERVLKLEPQFVAVFGRKSEEIFTLLHKARRQVETTAEALIEEYAVELDKDDIEGRERRRKWRTNVFASPNEVREDDEVGKDLREFRDRIEAVCRPLVDREFRRRRWWRGSGSSARA